MVKKNIAYLTWFNFFTDFTLYAPIAILYFTQVSGSYFLGMGVFSAALVSSALFEIPTGVFSDRIGRRKTVICGALAALVASIFYAIGQSFLLLFIGAIFDGLARSFYSGNNEALLYDTLASNNQEHHYSEHLGKTSSMFQFALGTSAILGGIIASWSFSLIMWLSVIPQLACLLIAFQLVEPQVHSKKSGNMYLHLKDSFKLFFSNEKLRLLNITSVIGFAFGEASYQFQAAFYITLWPLWAIGVAKTISNILAAVSYHFSGVILKRINGIKLLIIDNFYNRIVNILALLFPTIVSPLLMSSTSLFYGVGTVAKNTLFQKEFTNEQRATMGSLNSFAGNLLFGLVSLALGLVADKLTPRNALLFLQVLQIVNIFIYFQVKKSYKA